VIGWNAPVIKWNEIPHWVEVFTRMQKGMTVMSDVSTYTTEELKRLTTLTFETMRVMEYTMVGPVFMRTDKGVVSHTGTTYDAKNGGILNASPNRRVRSFTDLTELDPPQAAMLAEMERRKLAATFKAGDRVRYRWEANPGYVYTVDRVSSRSVWIGGIEADPIDLTPLPMLRFKRGDVVVRTDKYTQLNVGHLATVRFDIPVAQTRDMSVDWDTRISAQTHDFGWEVDAFRLATPADIAAFEARVKAQEDAKRPTFKVGDMVVAKANTAWTGPMVVRLQWSSGSYSCVHPLLEEGTFLAKELRPATDAEVAAYHKAHCVEKPAPTEPVKVTNEAHAGRLVVSKNTGNARYRLLDASSARVFQRSWSSEYGDMEFTWAMDDHGRIGGNLDWTLV